MVARGVLDADARQVVELHRLLGEAEHPGDEGLAGDDRGHRGEHHKGQLHRLGAHQEEEPLVHRLGVLEQVGPLPPIVEQERRHHQRVPADGDRLATEMPHVGVERLAAGDDEKDRAEGEEGVLGLVVEEPDRPHRVHRLDHLGRLEDPAQTENRQHREPDDHDRAEHLAHRAGAPLLDHEQQDQDDDGDGDHPVLE